MCAWLWSVFVIPDSDLAENGLLIVTGSTLRAEQCDRPLAYRLMDTVHREAERLQISFSVVVLSDLWYLNAEALQFLPAISLGGPEVNALAAQLYRKLGRALVVDNTLMIQMDLELEDPRASVWGVHKHLTRDALEIFIQKGYLRRFLTAAAARISG